MSYCCNKQFPLRCKHIKLNSLKYHFICRTACIIHRVWSCYHPDFNNKQHHDIELHHRMERSISSRGQQPSEKFLHIFRTRSIELERDKEGNMALVSCLSMKLLQRKIRLNAKVVNWIVATIEASKTNISITSHETNCRIHT